MVGCKSVQLQHDCEVAVVACLAFFSLREPENRAK